MKKYIKPEVIVYNLVVGEVIAQSFTINEQETLQVLKPSDDLDFWW